MIPIQIEDWQVYYRDGKQFLHTARAAHHKGKKAFSAATLYNLTCMGIEKLTMAFLMSRGDLAENHTMKDLFAALERHLGRLPDLEESFAYLDSFQEICDPEEAKIRIPENDDVIHILAIGDMVRRRLGSYLDN